ncbi:30S ribosomal protein S5 [Candidatus Falkowbacteria bacterium CG10_big_fil_rev_8_21_14_0_10_39_11]|uniref:Small ribosomal subunit protein uS5 n=1 Tax=Candidatus Falkowbacteria bacterium CG10_big_fil_rev_8_21_14_0_10_39_11 TaxID=1974565 RepID=A0A2H0V3Q1_9BACT|nr:MAG: 30S ribosomal protein S5 [Candidatus Falkowbacteria bacterium CG10_big_fil_rev_8_21_14_0_10_39_11]
MAKKYRKPNNRAENEFDQRVIDLARVTRVMAGGKRMRFRACVAIGDGKGRLGIGLAKGADVAIAINKAVNKAKKKMITVPIVKNSIPHRVDIKLKASKLMLKPAPEGTGVKAGGAIRVMLELAGIPNVVGKIMGSNNKINNAQALILALDSFLAKPRTKLEEKAKKEVKKQTPANKPVASKVAEKKSVETKPLVAKTVTKKQSDK